MKLIISLTLLFIAAACGPATNKGDNADTDELLADIMIRPAPNQPVIEITFYRDIVEVVNGKTNKGFGKNVVAVDDPQFNGVAMKAATNLSGQPIYKADVGGVKAANVITASVGGKRYEITTMLETKLIDKMTTVSLSPREKGGS